MPQPLKSTKKNLGLRAAAMACGSYAQLATRLGLTPAAVCQWDRVPEKRILAVERVSGVPREVLRPDLYR